MLGTAAKQPDKSYLAKEAIPKHERLPCTITRGISTLLGTKSTSFDDCVGRVLWSCKK